MYIYIYIYIGHLGRVIQGDYTVLHISFVMDWHLHVAPL